MAEIFIDNATGELKYQGTSGTPGILADSAGNIPLVPMFFNNGIVSGVAYANLNTFTPIGSINFDPSSFFEGNSKITRTIVFRALLSNSIGVTGEIKLYNLTLGADVTGSLLSSDDVSPIEYTATLTVGGNIPDSDNLYEVQFRISDPTPPLFGDYALCNFAAITVSYT